MRYRIPEVNTLGSMEHGDRRYDEACARHARDVLRKWVDDQGGQSEAARLLGVHQSTIARNLDMKSQPTLKVLLLLSKLTGMTLEHIFGLTPPKPPSTPVRLSDSDVLRVAQKVAEHVTKKITPPQGTESPQVAPKRGPPKPR